MEWIYIFLKIFCLCWSLFLPWQMIPQDFGQRLKTWSREGFRELGDSGKPGIGRTTRNVIQHRKFNSDPHWVRQYK